MKPAGNSICDGEGAVVTQLGLDVVTVLSATNSVATVLSATNSVARVLSATNSVATAPSPSQT